MGVEEAAGLQSAATKLRHLVILVATPSALGALAGGLVGGILAASAMELRTARGIERFHQARTLLAANGVTLESGQTGLDTLLVVWNGSQIADGAGRCPPGYPSYAFCMKIDSRSEREE